jgi:glucose-1-phosphate cytidylyltransferase|tara:strand:- start:4037 stop:4741 length:705 start_codon:yes stop_codon:yes gene_type:complete
MKIVILCGGKGTRLGADTKTVPKPMVKIGKDPILVHILKLYERYGFKDFILALGYKGEYIERFFRKRKTKLNIRLVKTGKNTLTGTRLLKLKKYLSNEENFMLTYGDGLSNQDLSKLLAFHKNHKKIGTMTVVRPPARFGEVNLAGNNVKNFKEKPQIKSGWINGGFFVFNKKFFKFLKKDSNEMLERNSLESLVKKRQLKAFKHKGFWQCMDTPRDKEFLKKLIKLKNAPWLN